MQGYQQVILLYDKAIFNSQMQIWGEKFYNLEMYSVNMSLWNYQLFHAMQPTLFDKFKITKHSLKYNRI